MKDAGYKYVVIDDCWHSRDRDARGNLQENPERFPSGIKELAGHIHSLGLKFGIYTDAGRQTCQGFPGSFGYEELDAKQFAEWGADYVKVDWCHTEGLDAKVQYAKWRDAILKSGRPMVLSICEWGVSRPWEWAGLVGHLWRTTGDIQDSWESMIAILDKQADLYPYAGLGHWNDPDMLEVGNGGMTEEEYRSHFSLWCILNAPLMAGNDLRNMSESTKKILTAPELIAINQDVLGLQAKRLPRKNGSEVWFKKIQNGFNSMAVVLLNRSSVPCNITVYWPDIDLPFFRASVRDLLERKDLGSFDDYYTARDVPPHGCVALKIRAI